jgi:hypothetical protein
LNVGCGVGCSSERSGEKIKSWLACFEYVERCGEVWSKGILEEQMRIIDDVRRCKGMRTGACTSRWPGVVKFETFLEAKVVLPSFSSGLGLNATASCLLAELQVRTWLGWWLQSNIGSLPLQDRDGHVERRFLFFFWWSRAFPQFRGLTEGLI